MRRVLLLLSATTVLLWASACSTVSLGYRNAPLLASLWVGRVFDLPTAQSDAVRAALDETWRWHVGAPRQELIGLLRETAARLDRPVTASDVAWAFDQFDRSSDRVSDVFARDLVKRWPAMDAEDITALEAHLAERRAEFADTLKEGDADAQALRRTDELVDELEDWFGHVTDAQQVYIVRSAAMHLDPSVWLAERARRHRELVAVLKRNPPEGLYDWIARWRETRPPQVVAEWARREAIYQRFWVELLAMAEPDQIAHAQARLRGWADDLAAIDVPTELAARGDAPCPAC
jgi:hypothetical protein